MKIQLRLGLVFYQAGYCIFLYFKRKKNFRCIGRLKGIGLEFYLNLALFPLIIKLSSDYFRQNLKKKYGVLITHRYEHMLHSLQ